MTVYSNNYDYKKKLMQVTDWDIPNIEKKFLREYVNEYAKGRITGRIGKNVDGNIEDILCKLKLSLSYINKNFDKITEKDLKRFVDNLIDDKIRKKIRKKIDGELQWIEIGNYTKTGKDKFIKNLALYLKFRFETKPVKLAKFLKIVRVIMTHVEKEVASLSYNDFDKIYDHCSNLSDRFYLFVNLWGGFRASEFHGIFESDIHMPNIEKGEEFVKIWIRHENSKTKGRMITLYGSDCYTIVKDYLKKRKGEGLKPDEPVYEKTHNSRKLWLRRLGIKYSLKLHPHLLRSTCATWLVDKGILRGYTDLIEWFGWTYGSTTPNRYIDRSKIKLKRIDENVKQTRFEELKAELRNQKERYETKQNQQAKDIERQKLKILEFEKIVNDLKKFDTIASNLFESKEVQKALLHTMIKNGLGKQLMTICEQ